MMGSIGVMRKRVGRVVLLATVSAMAWLALAVPALAEPTPTEQIQTEVTGLFDNMTTLVLGVVGGLFGLVLLGVGIRIGIKYSQRARSAA